jgi:peptidoglycan/LPS O-acetylase OafA/YrhL
MVNPPQGLESQSPDRLAPMPRLPWLDGLRLLAASLVLLYHAQLAFTGFGYTPQPTGLVENLQHLLTPRPEFAELGLPWQWVSVPLWFGFQWVDVFVLVSGFSLVVSRRSPALPWGAFWTRRLLRLLWPYWTVAWLAYPALWAMGTATNSYLPQPWSVFVGSTFPLAFDYAGSTLASTSGPWAFLPLMVSLGLLFPPLWTLLQRWGGGHLLAVSLVLTLGYRALAIVVFQAHPAYVAPLDGRLGDLPSLVTGQPLMLVLAKLSTFVVGMVVGQMMTQGRGPLFWPRRRAVLMGLGLYAAGFVCQFDRAGWIVADLLVPLGLSLLAMVAVRGLTTVGWLSQGMTRLGRHSYSIFLVHYFVVDRTVKLVVQSDANRYLMLLPVMWVGTLLLAMVVDGLMPLFRRLVLALLRDLDYVLARSPMEPRIHDQPVWSPRIGDVVAYQGQSHWRVLKVERLLDEQLIWLCQVTDGVRSLWVPAEELEPSRLEGEWPVATGPPPRSP